MGNLALPISVRKSTSLNPFSIDVIPLGFSPLPETIRFPAFKAIPAPAEVNTVNLGIDGLVP